MSSVQHLREFISERLAAAAEEIFTEFEKTIGQYEEEMDRQRRLLDITWKPPGNFHTAEVPHQYFCKEEEAFQADQQLCNQKCNSNLDQGRPESAHVKEEEEEENFFPDQDGEQLLLKDETDSYSVTAAHDENESDPEPNRDHVPTYTSPEDEHSHFEGNEVEDSSYLSGRHIFNQASFERLTKVHIDKKQYRCKTCRKRFKDETKLIVHLRTHTGEKPYSCKTCGKFFSRHSHLLCHMRTHTGEKPFSCKTCGKCFSLNGHLVSHMRTHTGEKPYSCKTCGKCFSCHSNLVSHMRTHTGERPFSCKTCGKCFSRRNHLVCHMRTHTGEKPYSCKTCGKCFSRDSHLVRHMGTHR